MMLLLPQKYLYQILVLRRKQCVVLYNPVLLNQGLVDFGYKESRGSHLTIIFIMQTQLQALGSLKDISTGYSTTGNALILHVIRVQDRPETTGTRTEHVQRLKGKTRTRN